MHPFLRALIALSAVLIAPASAMAAPSITLTTPADNAAYTTSPPATLADYACAPDPATSAAITQCTGTVANNTAIDTATAGTKVFTVTATDADGVTSTVTHN
jgi:hypothetical protein